MRNETYRGPRQDAVRRRRTYLQKKAKTSLATGIYGLTCCCGILFSVVYAYLACFDWHPNLPYIADQNAFGETYHEYFMDHVPGGLAFLAVGIAGFIGARSEAEKTTRLPYVPPVRIQVSALPDEEILVRGSARPTAEPGELLRAAHKGAETDSHELLRAGANTVGVDAQQ